MIELAIVGAGQLGSRHLQALSRLQTPARIFVVDPAPGSLAQARERWAQVEPAEHRIEVRFETDLSALPSHLHVAIVATNADVRPVIVENLLAAAKVDFLILEKVLAQSKAGIDRIASALATSGTKAWVNCPRRMWSFYRRLKERLGQSRLLKVDISGSDWGLGCNAIHFLDLVSWLNGSLNVTLSGDQLDRALIPAKRPGFMEFTGALTGVWDIGTSVRIASWRVDTSPFLIELRGEDIIAIIREDEGLAWIAERDQGWVWTQEQVSQEFQSGLTDRVVADLLATGSCELTPFPDSAELHAAMLGTLVSALAEMPGFATSESCPIT